MSWGNLQGAFVALLIVLFLGIIFWAYNPKNKTRLQEYGKLALEDDLHSDSNKSSNNHSNSDTRPSAKNSTHHESGDQQA